MIRFKDGTMTDRLFDAQIQGFLTLNPSELVSVYAAWVSTAERNAPDSPIHEFAIRLITWIHARILTLTE